uniref:DUF1365 domain-containing protein n=1 Tax=Pararhizobium sp. IMCC3301 TaxID=3067904 RepID=UPI002741E241|nr:DUF1365 domain-containing protein [Pararhizobium sp. IMCC3301]
MNTQSASRNALYDGKVMHARLKPMGHRFQYRVYALLLDLDQLPRAADSAIFSHNRFNLLSFFDKDHGARDGTSLRDYVDAMLQAAGEKPPYRIELLCYPRVFGWVFNPLSVYYCYDASDHLSALIYEVRNTFGEHHTYVAPVRMGESQDGHIRQERNKRFYVSPFIDMDMTYRFRLNRPDTALTLRILECDAEGPLLAATFSGKRRALTTANLLRAFVQVPFQTLKIVGGIHWEAFKLWVKGARFHRRPRRPKAVSYNDTHEPSDAPRPFVP